MQRLGSCDNAVRSLLPAAWSIAMYLGLFEHPSFITKGALSHINAIGDSIVAAPGRVEEGCSNTRPRNGASDLHQARE